MAATRKPAAVPRRKAGARGGRSANPARGEHGLMLGGKHYVLRPSFQASSAIEEETGLSLMELMRRANQCALSLSDLGVVCAELIRAGADKGDAMTASVSAERISELIFEEGMGAVTATVTLVLVDAIGGGRTAAGEPKAATGMTTTNPDAATAA